MKNPFNIHSTYSKFTSILLGIPIFILCAMLYVSVSNDRHEINPEDKLVPQPSAIYESIVIYTTENESRRKPTPPLFADTTVSLYRLYAGLALAGIVGLFLGINMGMFKAVDAALYPFITICNSIPPIAIMSILLVAFGKDDFGKIMMIFFGLIFVITQIVRLSVKSFHIEQLIKAQTLGASTFGIVYRTVLPRIFPKFIETLSINIGPAWTLLIISEFISSNQGLGYRIFLMRRGMDLSVILPYVAWITILGFLMVAIFKGYNKYFAKWYTGV